MSQTTALRTPPPCETSTDSSGLLLPQTFMSRVTGRGASLGASPLKVTLPESAPVPAASRSARTIMGAGLESISQTAASRGPCHPGLPVHIRAPVYPSGGSFLEAREMACDQA